MTAVDDVRANLLRGLEAGLQQIAQEVIDAAAPIISAEAIDRGDLHKSGEVAHVGELHWQAQWTSEHAAFVNDGTRPHWPPDEPIREWVRRNVRVVSIVTEAGPDREVAVKPKVRRGARKLRKASMAEDRLVWAIRAKIAKKGTEPVRFAERAVAIVMPRSPGIMFYHASDAMQGRNDPPPGRPS